MDKEVDSYTEEEWSTLLQDADNNVGNVYTESDRVIGRAVFNTDGTVDVVLDAMPINGRLRIGD